MTLRGDLTIAEGASVTSEAVEAHAVTVAGSLEGDVTARGPVRLGAGRAGARQPPGQRPSPSTTGARFSGRLECEFELPPELGGASQRRGARGRARRRR